MRLTVGQKKRARRLAFQHYEENRQTLAREYPDAWSFVDRNYLKFIQREESAHAPH